MIKTVTIKRFQGKDITPYINDLAMLRIHIFSDYPYLYAGELKYEHEYLQTYLDSRDSIMVLVFDGDKVVGASTAIPLKDESPPCQKPFIEHNIPVDSIFYLGESVLMPAYRGKNIYRHFFAEREAAAREQGYATTAFFAVERDANDPRRPAEYQPLDKVWEHFGYKKHPELCAYFSWKETGQTEETDKPLIFWLKNL